MKRKYIMCSLCLGLLLLVACDGGEHSLEKEESYIEIEQKDTADSEWTPDIY